MKPARKEERHEEPAERRLSNRAKGTQIVTRTIVTRVMLVLVVLGMYAGRKREPTERTVTVSRTTAVRMKLARPGGATDVTAARRLTNKANETPTVTRISATRVTSVPVVRVTSEGVASTLTGHTVPARRTTPVRTRMAWQDADGDVVIASTVAARTAITALCRRAERATSNDDANGPTERTVPASRITVTTASIGTRKDGGNHVITVVIVITATVVR
jgi:hypothetical protein